MTQTVLFVDGENFFHKIEDIYGRFKHRFDLAQIDLRKLLELSTPGIKIDRMIYYSSRVREYKETLKKSRELILFQRRLKTNLEKQGFEFVFAGNVRGQKIRVNGKSKIIFREKGVDVKIAVDMVSLAADKKLGTAIFCSSDSDLQPAIYELKKRRVKIVYLGFSDEPNRGLMYTTDKTILISNRQVKKSCPKRKK